MRRQITAKSRRQRHEEGTTFTVGCLQGKEENGMELAVKNTEDTPLLAQHEEGCGEKQAPREGAAEKAVPSGDNQLSVGTIKGNSRKKLRIRGILLTDPQFQRPRIKVSRDHQGWEMG